MHRCNIFLSALDKQQGGSLTGQAKYSKLGAEPRIGHTLPTRYFHHAQMHSALMPTLEDGAPPNGCLGETYYLPLQCTRRRRSEIKNLQFDLFSGFPFHRDFRALKAAISGHDIRD
jgi:hypothetical protein